ncbi:photo-regulated tyrosinase [Multifurca ochricompacta]|uniref:tyrosinase n=1 Tax=Multifurca ochricompacta TaxID=376703 RepID=A0AAD4M2Z7_9AGAM|nr:photo-regulated tyrosinase [Multifurca ochricompacta]
MSPFIITGAAAPNRIEINDFVKIEDQFSLYIQALTAMQKDKQTNSTSHFGIGGIHGVPYIQWEASGDSKPVKWDGYCTHGSVLFPTWHRPYVALYEQVLQHHALEKAKTYQVDRERWIAAAENLRAPYWDWATDIIPPAEVISLAFVDIITPDGKRTPVENPLLQYAFSPVHKDFPDRYKSWKTTIRHPDHPGSPDARTDVQGLKLFLKGFQEDVTRSTLDLFNRVHSWKAFSNSTRGDDGTASNSLEAIHDLIHFAIGGHMGSPAVAGFDPIFYLHHANVDRLLSLWSAVNPGVWVSPGDSKDGTFTIGHGVTLDTNTPLTPFWNSSTGYWASTDTAGTVGLGYSYPEFNEIHANSASAIQESILKYVYRQYGGSLIGLFGAVGNSGVKTASAESSTSEIVVYDWTTRIASKKYELGKGFAVLVFLGDVPEDPSAWHTSPALVGAHAAFVNTAVDQDGGLVRLTSAIAKLSGLSSLDPEVVRPYLEENLHWRIQAVDDRSAVRVDEIPSLEVTVAVTPLTQQPGTIFPVAGETEYHRGVTQGRPGGAREAQA